jgi:protein-S-isoprenylcysteine O-methyltransferase Ste14
MAPTPRPVHPLLTVFLAVFATLCFAASSNIHSGLRWLPMGAGVVLLVLAIAGITARRRGAPEAGWLPSREKSAREKQ